LKQPSTASSLTEHSSPPASLPPPQLPYAAGHRLPLTPPLLPQDLLRRRRLSYRALLDISSRRHRRCPQEDRTHAAPPCPSTRAATITRAPLRIASQPTDHPCVPTSPVRLQQIITAGTPPTRKAAADHHSRDAVNAQSSSRSSQQGRRQLAKQHRSSQHHRGTKKQIHCIVRLPNHAQSNSRSSQQRRSRLAQHRRLHSQLVEQRDSVITSKVCQSHAQRRHYVHQ
jgi:hypothetical protein